MLSIFLSRTQTRSIERDIIIMANILGKAILEAAYLVQAFSAACGALRIYSYFFVYSMDVHFFM